MTRTTYGFSQIQSDLLLVKYFLDERICELCVMCFIGYHYTCVYADMINCICDIVWVYLSSSSEGAVCQFTCLGRDSQLTPKMAHLCGVRKSTGPRWSRSLG